MIGLKLTKNRFISEDAKYLVPIFLLLLVEYFIIIDIPFFWDGISKASRASWIFENNFSSLIVPSDINSGHPPLWIASLALTWEVLGKSLWASRLLLLFINFGVFYQLYRLVRSLFADNVPPILFFFICLEPTLLAQTTSLNNDMMLLFFTVLGCNAVLKNKTLLLTLALVGVLMTNLRGVYIFIALAISHYVLHKNDYIEATKKQLLAYLIALIMFLLFAIYQYYEIGWAIISKQSNYAQHREVATFQRIAKNGLAYLKFYLDFGRIFIVIPLLILLWKYRKPTLKFNKAIHKTFLLLMIFAIVFFFGIVPFSNPSGPRYVMFAYIITMILFVNLLYDQNTRITIKKWILPVVSIGLISGHFWIYPPKIAQAWDSSLAYLNYFPVENKMRNYIETNKINQNQIGTYLRWNEIDQSYARENKEATFFQIPDLNRDQFIVLSNVENSMPKETIDIVMHSWLLKQKFSQMGVFVSIYEKPKY